MGLASDNIVLNTSVKPLSSTNSLSMSYNFATQIAPVFLTNFCMRPQIAKFRNKKKIKIDKKKKKSRIVTKEDITVRVRVF